MASRIVDLGLAGVPRAVAAIFFEDVEPTLVDPGPASTLPTLLETLSAGGVGVRDIRRVVLTHIHLDHAGATGSLVALNPQIRVYVHEDGAPHLVDPERLISSTRRTFGDRSDELWGETESVPKDAIEAWRPSDPKGPAGLRVLPSPGHISHHLAYQNESDGTLYSGDAMGIVLHPKGPVHPPTPPPSLDFQAWYDTLEAWDGLDVPSFIATHFGEHDDFDRRRLELLDTLKALEQRVQGELEAGVDGGADYGNFVVDRMASAGDGEAIRNYFAMFPADVEWQGAAFHLKRRTSN